MLASFSNIPFSFLLPLFFLYALTGRIKLTRLLLYMKIAIALTFTAHGLYAVGVYPPSRCVYRYVYHYAWCKRNNSPATIAPCRCARFYCFRLPVYSPDWRNMPLVCCVVGRPDCTCKDVGEFFYPDFRWKACIRTCTRLLSGCPTCWFPWLCFYFAEGKGHRAWSIGHQIPSSHFSCTNPWESDFPNPTF
jgi:hypothetical protein